MTASMTLRTFCVKDGSRIIGFFKPVQGYVGLPAGYPIKPETAKLRWEYPVNGHEGST
jgi:hypothetical protein